MLSKSKAAGERLPEFEEWLAGRDKEGVVSGRLAETFYKLAKEVDQRREQSAADDIAKVQGKRDARAAALAKSISRDAKMAQKRAEWESAMDKVGHLKPCAFQAVPFFYASLAYAGGCSLQGTGPCCQQEGRAPSEDRSAVLAATPTRRPARVACVAAANREAPCEVDP